MIAKTLLSLFRGSAPTNAPEGNALTLGDRQALAADLAYADAAQPGLGKALLGFVLTGEGEAVLLQVEHLLQAPQPAEGGLRDALVPSVFYYYRIDAGKKEAHDRRLAARYRVLYGMEGFDAAVMRRFALVFAPTYANGSHRYRFPGSDRSPLWLRGLLDLMRSYRHHDMSSRARPLGPLTAPRIRAMLDLEHGTVAPLVDCLFVDSGARSTAALLDGHHALAGLAGVLAAEPEAVVAALRPMAAPARAAMAGFLARNGLLDLPAFFDFAFTLAAGGAKGARVAGLAALGAAPAERVQARAAELLASASADDRLAAVNALVARFGAGSLPGLVAHEAGERSKKALEAIAAARAKLTAPQDGAATARPEDGADGYTGMDGVYVPAPPRMAVPDTVPPDTAEVFRTLMETANAAARRDYHKTPPEQRDSRHYPKMFEVPFKPGIAPQIAAVLQGATSPASASAEVSSAASGWMPHFMVEAQQGYMAGMSAFLDRPDLSIMALTRLRLADSRERAWDHMLSCVLARSGDYTPAGRAIGKRLGAGADFRDVVDAAEAAGHPTAAEMPHALQHMVGWQDHDTPPNPTIWPVLAAQFNVLDAAFAPGTRERSWVSMSVTGLLNLFPTVPRRYFPYLIDRAATGNPLARNQARALLRGAGDLTPIIATMLGSGDASRRIGGARWMAERRDPAAIPPLRAAAKAEKNIAAKAAILAALAACGDDISGEFSEDRLLAEAEAGLPKTKVDYSSLFDAAALPALHWADGREVPGRVVQWWFARAHKLKQPGGDPLLHMALDRLDRRDAERLGQAVLAAFIQFDTRKAGSEAANAYAQANAASRAQSYQRWKKDYTEADAFAELRREMLGQYLGSALPHQGLLALARFAVPADAAAMVRRYLRDHGKRSNQCRALLDALAANPVPAVLQLILATSQRHKQPGTRKYAGELAASLAEERGWTPAELADRTIPSAGLDDDGVLDLLIGARAYRARIAEARGKAAAKDGGLALVLENPDGKAIASLPTPTDPAEAEEASAAKKALSAAKKELKQTVESQTTRLYEAMCASRTWPVADFDAYLMRHPIAGRLLRRLILAGFDAEGRAVATFRPLDDGTFSDAADGPVALDGFANIGIAHRATLGEEAAAAWATHLEDYEVRPLFEQLNRLLLTPADAKATGIEDRVGWLIDSTTLRTAATALGYQRGSIEDGGCFFGYEKHLPDLGIAAVVGFTGSFVPETERRPGALRTLTFVRLRPGGSAGWGQTGLPLGKVPPVLLSEAWNDLHAIAAQGAGFDAEWEKKALW